MSKMKNRWAARSPKQIFTKYIPDAVLPKAVAVFAALAVWEIAALAVGKELLLVSPIRVLRQLFILCTEKSFLPTVLFSVCRITIGYLAAVAVGFLLAVCAGRFRRIEQLLWPYMVTVKAVPVASFIILFLIWMSFAQLTVFITFLIVLPIVYGNILQGMKNADAALLEMTALYRVPWMRRFRAVYLPSLRPYLLSACSVSVGMAWKSGVAAEVIGVVTGSVGAALYEAKIYLNTAELFAWTVLIVLLSVLEEKCVQFLLKKVFGRTAKRKRSKDHG